MSGRRKLLALALGSGLALAGLELAARAVYQPDWERSLLSAQAQTQAVYPPGVRGGLPSATKATDERRVLLLGDSYTYGIGVSETEAVAASLLQRRLSAEGAPVVVTNGGIPGSLTSEWVEFQARHEAVLQPDLVVVVFFLRDGTRAAINEIYFDTVRRHVEPIPLLDASALVRLVQQKRGIQAAARRYQEEFARAYRDPGPAGEEWRLAQENLRTIRARAEAGGAQVALVVFPILAQLDQDPYPFGGEVELIRDWGLEEGWPTLSLLDAFQGRRASELWAAPHDQHPNAEGHRVVADAMEPFIRELLPPAPGPADEEPAEP